MTAPAARAALSAVLRPPTAPAALSVRWRYTFCDLLTSTPIAVLPLIDADLTEVIGGAGDGTGRVPLLSTRIRRLNPWAATTPRRTICYAQRLLLVNGRAVAAPVMWHGIVWGRVRSGFSLNLKMSTPESYYDRRLTPAKTWTATDDATMLKELFQLAEAEAAGHLRLTYDTPLAGVVSDRTMLLTDRKTYLEIAKSIATAGDGLDWRIAPGVDPATGAFTRTLTCAPRLGRTGLQELTWQTRSRSRAQNEVIGYELEEDGTNVPNRVHGLGDGTGDTQLYTVVNASDVGNTELADGFPLLEAVLPAGTSYKTVATLDRHCRGVLLAAKAHDARINGLTVRGDRAPSVDRYILGDELTLNLADPLHTAPVTVRGRLVARRFIPPQRGRTEKVAMTLGAT